MAKWILSVHIILSKDASSSLQATYPSFHLNCSALSPFFERCFKIGGPRGTGPKLQKMDWIRDKELKIVRSYRPFI